jgi:hypothetical protein
VFIKLSYEYPKLRRSKLICIHNEQSLIHFQESDSSHFRYMILLGMIIIITKVSRGVNIKNINVMEMITVMII